MQIRFGNVFPVQIQPGVRLVTDDGLRHVQVLSTPSDQVMLSRHMGEFGNNPLDNQLKPTSGNRFALLYEQNSPTGRPAIHTVEFNKVIQGLSVGRQD